MTNPLVGSNKIRGKEVLMERKSFSPYNYKTDLVYRGVAVCGNLAAVVEVNIPVTNIADENLKELREETRVLAIKARDKLRKSIFAFGINPRKALKNILIKRSKE